MQRDPLHVMPELATDAANFVVLCTGFVKEFKITGTAPFTKLSPEKANDGMGKYELALQLALKNLTQPMADSHVYMESPANGYCGQTALNNLKEQALSHRARHPRWLRAHIVNAPGACHERRVASVV